MPALLLWVGKITGAAEIMGLVKSWMEISEARLKGNLRAVQVAAGAEVEVLAVVKANGYGHDAALVAGVLMDSGVGWLGVSDLEEGVRVRQAGAARVLVMCGMEPEDAPAMVRHGLTPVVWTAAHVEAVERAGQDAGRSVAVHLELDTGMARQGTRAGSEMAEVLERLAASPSVRLEGVMSHLVEAERSGSAVTAAQLERFRTGLDQVAAAGFRPELLHLGNTSAVDEGSTMEWLRAAAAGIGAQPMVRTGLALYGDSLPLEGAIASGALKPSLLPVLTWKTRIVGLRDIEPGTTVGYGATFVAERPMRIALLPVGYADGFRREASSGVGDGWVMVCGRPAPVVGRVSMNLLTVDVTGLSAAVGDEVVLLGEGVSADDHARWCGTIAYEILCGMRASQRLI